MTSANQFGKLEISLEQLEQIFDTLSDVVCCVKDLEGRYQMVNHAFVARANARSKNAVVGRRAIDIFPLELASEYDAQDQTVFRSGRGFQDRLEQITNADGTIGWYLASKFPWRNQQLQVIGLISLSQDLHTPSDSELELSQLNLVVEYIRQHLNENLAAGHLGQMIGLTPFQLDRRMRRVFRLSLKKFIMKTRLEEVSRRLIETDQPLSKIALACGFNDQSALTRQFRATALMPPAAFRLQHRQRSS
jgi:PAS domain S-box-containing protein